MDTEGSDIRREQKRSLRVLLICDYRPLQAATVVDHINAFPQYSRHEIYVLSGMIENMGSFPALKIQAGDQTLTSEYSLDYFDVVIVHYSMSLALNSYISVQAKHRLRQFNGLKAIFIQDEYRFVDRTIKAINDLGFKVIFTCVPEDQIELVYPTDRLPGVRKVNVLTGYVAESVLVFPIRPISKRSIDISYRGRKYPAWHGELGLQKWAIAKAFLKYRHRPGLKLDISYREKDRVYGIEWVNLLRNSRAVLGVESGASVFDFDGSISAKTEVYETLLGERRVSYDELREKYFGEHEGRIRLNQISPRLFEAIALGTLLVIYEGEYSGILEAWRHYVPVKRDHSNIPEVLKLVKDDRLVAEITTNAYTEIALNPDYSYQTFIGRVDDVLAEEIGASTSASHRRSDVLTAPGEDGEVFEIWWENGEMQTASINQRIAVKPNYDRFSGLYYTPYPHSLSAPKKGGRRFVARVVAVMKRLLLRK